MRIKLTLIPKEKKCSIPLNYQYPLSAAIYKILYAASNEYADFLHDKGYVSESGKPLKLFTFSYLFMPRVKLQNGRLTCYGSPRCTLNISSPLIEDFIQNLVIGLFENQEIAIGSRDTVGRFLINQVESLPAPDFSDRTKFKCLSPFVLATMKERNGKLMPYYYRPDDPELAEAIRLNLLQKYQTVYKKLPDDSALVFEIDENYVTRKGGFDKISKLITLKENDEKGATRIKAILAPFTLTGSTELMTMAWEAGIGTHCSQGFGMVEVVEQRS